MVTEIETQPTAVVIGVGAEDGLGAGLVERFAREGFRVVIAGRCIDRLVRVAQNIAETGGNIVPVVANATTERELVSLFDYAQDGGSLDVVVFDAGEIVRQALTRDALQLLEHAWRSASLASSLVGQEAARRLVPQRSGTVIFIGAVVDPAVAGNVGLHPAVVLRSVAQSLAYEMRPFGIHVAHVMVDDGLDDDTTFHSRGRNRVEPSSIESVVNVCWAIHAEPSHAWTHELDLRPVAKSIRTMWQGAFDSKTGVQHGIAE